MNLHEHDTVQTGKHCLYKNHCLDKASSRFYDKSMKYQTGHVPLLNICTSTSTSTSINIIQISIFGLIV